MNHLKKFIRTKICKKKCTFRIDPEIDIILSFFIPRNYCNVSSFTIARWASVGGGGGRTGQLHDGGLAVDGLESVGRLLRGLGVLVLVVGEPVAELLVIHPLVSQTQVEH